MSKLMGIREYSRYRGCSHVAVLKAITSGRLHRSIVKSNGAKKINPRLANAEWDTNTLHKMNDLILNIHYLEDIEIPELEIPDDIFD